MRLFVDCDDTLVLWQEEHRNQDKSLYLGDKYSINTDLIEIVEHIQDTHDAQLIVWSGGGVEYAAMWARRFGLKNWLTAPKDMRLPQSGDVVFDDMELTPKDSRVKVYSPDTKVCPVCKPVPARNETRKTSGKALDSIL